MNSRLHLHFRFDRVKMGMSSIRMGDCKNLEMRLSLLVVSDKGRASLPYDSTIIASNGSTGLVFNKKILTLPVVYQHSVEIK